MNNTISILAIDSGNSFLKWGILKNNQWAIAGKVENNEIKKLSDTWQFLNHPDIIIISQVSESSVRNQLSSLFKIWNTEPYWIVPLRRQCGVTNNYENPGQLGSDRWAALIAAWSKYRQSCLVVNIGTCMTVDAVSNDGVFLGGIIVPGPFIQLKSVQLNTQIDFNTEKLQYEFFPINTANALYSGVIQSLVGSIERMKHMFYNHLGYHVKNCIVSGGGAIDILPAIDFNYTVIDNLVLDGLVIIAKDMQIKKIVK